jgi:SAM-dependent methyltransferase
LPAATPDPVLKLVARIAREMNWARRRWSNASDREFHEQLYRSDDYDPFSLAYPGFTTIRRFADLVEPHLPDHGSVVDLGCGPGEITCELAARRNDLTFLGVDHSAAAVAKARHNMSRRSLTNLRFECANVEEYAPPGDVDLATLFDAFHHLLDPARFVRRLQPQVKRWALVEPRGSWAGTWRKDLDFDWVAQDLDKIRAHIAACLSQASSVGPTSSRPSGERAGPTPCSDVSAGEAVERRYTLDDFRRFFDGLALDLRGTVAGLETYPPGFGTVNGVRERFGEMQYQLYRDIDAWLFERNLDLHAKHWLIIAERHGRSREVALSHEVGAEEHPRVAGAFDVSYGEYHGPRDAKADEPIMATVGITNAGWDEWSSAAEPAVFVSYHWLDAKGRIVLFDGERTPLPRSIGPGSVQQVAFTARAPSVPGQYRLAVDLVREGVTWFSQAGHPCLEIPFRVIA